MFPGYFEVSVNFNVENRREKFIILVSILYPIYSIPIRSQNLLCFLCELLMSFLTQITYVVGSAEFQPSNAAHEKNVSTFLKN